MTDQPNRRSATADDAKARSAMAKKAEPGTGDKSSTTDSKSDHFSEQYKAAQKILAEVNQQSLKSQLAQAEGSVILLAAVQAPGSDAPGKVVPTSKAAVLDHHNADFFKHDFVHDTERISNVIGNSFSKYLKQGIAEAGKENFENGEWVGKFETGAMIGAALRTVLPKEGVVRALASTVMAFNMARDLAQPLYSGAKDAVAARDDKDLDNASRKVSKGVGNFVVDNLIGLPAASFGASATGVVLENAAPGFELKKTEFWASDKTRVGRFFNGTAERVDRATSNLRETIKPSDPEELARSTARRAVAKLPAEAKLKLLEEAGEHAKKHIQSAEFYKLGPEVNVADLSERTQTAPLKGSTADERPISLGAIRRMKTNEASAKFSTGKATASGKSMEPKERE